jgi:hypothetical protein
VPKGKGILMGVPRMTKEWKGETVQMPEAFGIKSGKSPNFGRIKARFVRYLSVSHPTTSQLKWSILIAKAQKRKS